MAGGGLGGGALVRYYLVGRAGARPAGLCSYLADYGLDVHVWPAVAVHGRRGGASLVAVDVRNVPADRLALVRYLLCCWAWRAGWGLRSESGRLVWARNAGGCAAPWA